MAEATPGTGPRRCASRICSKPLPADARPGRRYCSGACRQEAHRARHRYGAQPTGPHPADRKRAAAEQLRAQASRAEQLARSLRLNLLQRVIWPGAHHRGTGPGGYTTAAAALAAAADQVLAAAVAADRAAGLSWQQIGQQLGVDASTARRRYTATTGPGDRPTELGELLARLPADTRPAPSVTPYDQLLRARPPAPPPARAGHDWDDTEVCLWREDGRWELTGPDGPIEVPEFGLFGNGLAARDTKGAQAAAAAAITALTGRSVTGWDQDASSRSVYGPASWYACLGTQGR